MKACAYCGELIQDLAKKCRYCGERVGDKKNEKPDEKDNETSHKEIPKEEVSSNDKLKIAEKSMSQAFGAAIVSIVITIIIILSGSGIGGIDQYAWLDVIIIALLAYGVRKKRKIPVIMLFIYFLASKIIMIIEGPQNGAGIGVGIIFLVLYYRGIQGVLNYEKLTGKQTANVWEIIGASCIAILLILSIIGVTIG